MLIRQLPWARIYCFTAISAFYLVLALEGIPTDNILAQLPSLRTSLIQEILLLSSKQPCQALSDTAVTPGYGSRMKDFFGGCQPNS